VEADVYVWRYTLLVVHARKEQEELSVVGCTDADAVWDSESGASTQLCIRWELGVHVGAT